VKEVHIGILNVHSFFLNHVTLAARLTFWHNLVGQQCCKCKIILINKFIITRSVFVNIMYNNQTFKIQSPKVFLYQLKDS